MWNSDLREFPCVEYNTWDHRSALKSRLEIIIQMVVMGSLRLFLTNQLAYFTLILVVCMQAKVARGMSPVFLCFATNWTGVNSILIHGNLFYELPCYFDFGVNVPMEEKFRFVYKFLEKQNSLINSILKIILERTSWHVWHSKVFPFSWLFLWRTSIKLVLKH